MPTLIPNIVCVHTQTKRVKGIKKNNTEEENAILVENEENVDNLLKSASKGLIFVIICFIS
jgi:hypothetical protein